MSFVKLPKERFEKFSITLHPVVDFISSSVNIPRLGVTVGTSGSTPMRARPSPAVRELVAAGVLGQLSNDINADPGEKAFSELDFSSMISLGAANGLAEYYNILGVGGDISPYMKHYLSGVNHSPLPIASTKKIFITRFDPPFSLNDVAIEKSVIRENLMTFYESRFDLCEMAYTNYHSLNFFSAPDGPGVPDSGEVGRIPDSSAIIYQNFVTGSGPRPYAASGSFSFDFWINPRYPNNEGREFKAGTILFLICSFLAAKYNNVSVYLSNCSLLFL